MKRKVSTTPTRVYAFGCLPPVKGVELLERQMKLAHRYRNALVEIELDRREQVQRAMRGVGDVGAIAAVVDKLETQLATLRTVIATKRSSAAGRVDVREETERAKTLVSQIHSARVTSQGDLVGHLEEELAHVRRSIHQKRASGSRSAATSTDGDQAKQLVEELRNARTALREAKQRIRDDERLTKSLEEIDDRTREKIRKARASCRVYHSTYNLIEASAGQARRSPGPPRFTRFDGSGFVAVQMSPGLTLNELFGCEDRRLRIRPVPHDTYERPRHQRRLASRTLVSLRVGSEGAYRSAYSTPLWVELPVVLHRPMPDDAIIKWARIMRRKVGLRFEYALHLIIESETFRTPERPPGSGVVAVDFGWRRKPDGSTRVAFWVDSDGQSGEMLLPLRTELGIEKTDSLRSIRDREFDAMHAELRTWIEENAEAPDWFKTRTKGLGQWRSQAMLGALLRDWNAQRFVGDEVIVARLRAWAKQDRHLLAWEANQRDRRLGHRSEEYRRFAVKLAKRYGAIVLQNVVFSGLPTKRAPEEGVVSDGARSRRMARLAAPGALRLAIKQAATKYGARVFEVDATDVTRTCHACGVFDDARSLESMVHTCRHCGETWDQDQNTCTNMLAFADVSSTATNTSTG